MTFQSSAFQNDAFQTDSAGGGGFIWNHVYSAVRRRELALAAQRKQSPTKQEVDTLLASARTRLNLRIAPYVTTDLAPLIAQMRACQAKAEEDQFLADILQMLDAEDGE